MTPKQSLSTCPDVVYREITKNLAPEITTQCDFAAYLALQTCCNTAFAREVRSVMKKPLQLAQAILAFHKSPCYALHHPCIRHNPVYMTSLTYKRLGELSPMSCRPNHVKFVPLASYSSRSSISNDAQALPTSNTLSGRSTLLFGRNIGCTIGFRKPTRTHIMCTASIKTWSCTTIGV